MASNAGISGDDDSLLSDINVARLVYVMLVLLIAFTIAVAAMFTSSPVKVNLPGDGTVAMSPKTSPLNFSLRREADGELGLYLNEHKTDAASLRALVEQVGIPAHDQPVSLAADMGIPYGEVVKIMGLLQTMGLEKISLDTRHVEAT